MNIPMWIWYILGGTIVLLVLGNAIGAVWGYRRFRSMDQGFQEQRERVRANLRKGARQ